MKEIPLTRGLIALVDDADFDELSLHKWYANEDGYAVRNAPHPTKPGRRIVINMHRQIFGLEYGDKMRVDHRDEKKANNQRYNLRLATPSQNQCNIGRQSNNTSGFKGVSWHKKNRLWHARIKIGGKCKSLGYFRTPEAAHAAYCSAAAEIHGEFANTGVKR